MKPIVVIVLGIAVAASAAVYLSRQSSGDPQKSAPLSFDANSGGGHTRGNPKATATLVEFGDYQCPSCGFYHPMVSELLRRYPDKVKLEFHHYPLVQMHPFAFAAATAAEAAGEQGHYWEMHDLLYANQNTWSRSANPETYFVAYASQVGLNSNQFMQALRSPEIQQRILQDVERGRNVKVEGTPTFFVNGKEIRPLPNNVDDFIAAIDAPLTSAK